MSTSNTNDWQTVKSKYVPPSMRNTMVAAAVPTAAEPKVATVPTVPMVKRYVPPSERTGVDAGPAICHARTAAPLATEPVNSSYVAPGMRKVAEQTFDQMYPEVLTAPAKKDVGTSWSGNFKAAIEKAAEVAATEDKSILASHTNTLTGKRMIVRDMGPIEGDDDELGWFPDMNKLEKRRAATRRQQEQDDETDSYTATETQSEHADDSQYDSYSEPDSNEEEEVLGYDEE